jgi:hypothetical protein
LRQMVFTRHAALSSVAISQRAVKWGIWGKWVVWEGEKSGRVTS